MSNPHLHLLPHSNGNEKTLCQMVAAARKYHQTGGTTLEYPSAGSDMATNHNGNSSRFEQALISAREEPKLTNIQSLDRLQKQFGAFGGTPGDLDRVALAFAQASQVNTLHRGVEPMSLSPNDLITLVRTSPDLTGLGGGSALEIFHKLSKQQLQKKVLPTPAQAHQEAKKIIGEKTSPEEETNAKLQVQSDAAQNGIEALADSTLKDDSTSERKKESNSPSVTIILPCRARGMPVDHNFRSAHFLIPSYVSHGEELICSYESCRNAGIKFRYCAACSVPVAKRNFHQRHSHGIPIAQDVKRRSSPLPLEESAEKDRSTAASEPGPITSKSPSQDIQKNETSSEPSNYGVSSSDDSTPPDLSLSRQLRWASLLGKRPLSSDDDLMSAWLLEVMAVSDKKTPLRTSELSSLTNYSSGSSSAPHMQPKSDDLFGEDDSYLVGRKKLRTRNRSREERWHKKRRFDPSNHEDRLERGEKKRIKNSFNRWSVED